MYFNKLRYLISDECYYYFTDGNKKIIYKGYLLPVQLDDLFITDISGGEDEHGCCLYFDCVVTEYYEKGEWMNESKETTI